MPVTLGERLSLGDVVSVSRGEAVALSPAAVDRMRATRAVVEAKVAEGETVYGVTTGFGSLANVRISPEQAATLQHSIVRSHATAVGRPLSRAEARAMLALRAHVLALGHSGVRVEIVERMIEMLNRDLVPVVPEQGSLGASGDLAPLANLALPLIGGGEILTADDGRRPAAEAMREAGLEPLVLQAKEGLALVNGTQGMLAVGILAGSGIMASHRDSEHLVQDAYSLRCAPQVHGATREVLRFAEGVLEVEANSVSDNPIVLSESDEVLSGGNFHGQPVAVALDALAAATVPLASISERRLYRLLDPTLNNGLPACMVAARHARDIVANAEIGLALEAMAAAQAQDLRAPLEPAVGTEAALHAVRGVVPHLDADRELGPDIAAATDLVRTGALVAAAEGAIGSLG